MNSATVNGNLIIITPTINSIKEHIHRFLNEYMKMTQFNTHSLSVSRHGLWSPDGGTPMDLVLFQLLSLADECLMFLLLFWCGGCVQHACQVFPRLHSKHVHHHSLGPAQTRKQQWNINFSVNKQTEITPHKECLHAWAVIASDTLKTIGQRQWYFLFARLVYDVLRVFTWCCITHPTQKRLYSWTNTKLLQDDPERIISLWWYGIFMLKQELYLFLWCV